MINLKQFFTLRAIKPPRQIARDHLKLTHPPVQLVDVLRRKTDNVKLNLRKTIANRTGIIVGIV